MSYTFYASYPSCDKCGSGGDSHNLGNYTSNMAPAWREAGIDFVRLDGLSCVTVADRLDQAIDKMRKHRAEYSARFDAPNGWGSMDTLIPFLISLLDGLRGYPSAKFEVSC